MITAVADKIIRFNTIDELKTAIGNDLKSKNVLAQRYCVRFIMLNDFKTFRELTKFLVGELGVKMFELQNLTLGDDKTITIDMLSEAVTGISETSLVTPFSELVRFYKEEEFNGFFNEIILTEDLMHPGKRIYIPIIGLNNRFNDFLKNFGRIQESAPIWQFYSPQDDKVKVFVSKFRIPFLPKGSEYYKLDTMKDWLNFWRKQAPQEKILCSAKPIRTSWQNSRPDSIFTFEEVKNIHDFITEFLGITIQFDYKETESYYWEKLLEAISSMPQDSFSWKSYVEKHFNSWEFSLNRILDIWADEQRTNYDRWLLKNYLLHTNHLDSKPYTRLCLEETSDYSNPAVFFVKLAERIFYTLTAAEREKYTEERYKILHSEAKRFKDIVPKSSQDWIMEQLVSIAQNESVLNIAKKLCTGIFDFEKELYFGWYQLHSDNDFGLSHLKEFYPDLHAYLVSNDNSIYQPGAEWLSGYFKAYREAKIKDCYTDDVKTFIENYNASDASFWDWYYKHSTCHDLYHEVMNDLSRKPDRIYWIDGLGAEFIPFIKYLIENSKSGFDIIEAKVATTGLPSTTSLNRFDVDDKTIFKFDELDDLAHSGHYRSRKTLIEELNTIRKIVTTILRDNSVGNHTIAIVSDHGLSALSRLCEPHKLTGKAHHEGRYIPYTSDMAAESMPEYITVKNPDDNQDYKVALKHSSLGRKPSHEVHGGCTPEEVLVPFIVLTNIDASKPLKYDIKPIKTDYPISNPVFECIINPKPKSAKLIVGGDKIDMIATETKWSGCIPNAIEGSLEVSVLPDRGKPVTFDVNIYGMGMGNSLSDFDL